MTFTAILEMYLLKCSLLPDETLTFLPPSEDATAWISLLESYPDSAPTTTPTQPPQFRIKPVSSSAWFEVALPAGYRSNTVSDVRPVVSVKAAEMTRQEHERWQAIIANSLNEVAGNEYTLFELMSTHLLPLLQAEIQTESSSETPASLVDDVTSAPTRYHSLLTSHHLISPVKRRSLKQWATSLCIVGFAKVGYPGVIYCEDAHESVQEFVENVKAMQWLALRVRFMEPVPNKVEHDASTVRWVEFEKMGKVVEEMRRLDRESCVVEMGIGVSAK